MRVLALDTTRRDGSLALVEGNRVVAEHHGDPSRSHAERLPGDILALLDVQGMTLADVDLFAVASGPGSFTGLRVGIATIQGLAFVSGRKVVAVSALEALAHATAVHHLEGAIVGAWMDAHRAEVFTALYRWAPRLPFGPSSVTEIEGPAVREPLAALTQWAPLIAAERVVFAGDGATLYEPLIRARRPNVQVFDPPILAGTIGLMAAARADKAIEPSSIRPLYVRRPDAEVDRERKALAKAGATGPGKP